jgi:hypothetical protein
MEQGASAREAAKAIGALLGKGMISSNFVDVAETLPGLHSRLISSVKTAFSSTGPISGSKFAFPVPGLRRAKGVASFELVRGEVRVVHTRTKNRRSCRCGPCRA